MLVQRPRSRNRACIDVAAAACTQPVGTLADERESAPKFHILRIRCCGRRNLLCTLNALRFPLGVATQGHVHHHAAGQRHLCEIWLHDQSADLNVHTLGGNS